MLPLLSSRQNSAAGKSTFLTIVAQRFTEFTVVQEPLSRWTNVQQDSDEITASQKHGGNLLELFYTDTKRWAYTCESCLALSPALTPCQSRLGWWRL